MRLHQFTAEVEQLDVEHRRLGAALEENLFRSGVGRYKQAYLAGVYQFFNRR